MVCIQQAKSDEQVKNQRKNNATGAPEPEKHPQNTPNANMDLDDDRLQLQHLAGGDLTSHPPLFSPDGELIFLIRDKIIQVFSTSTGVQTRRLTGAAHKIVNMQFELGNQEVLIACTETGNVHRWMWSTGTLENTLKMSLPAGVIHTFNLLNLYGNSETPHAFVTLKPLGAPIQAYVVDTTTGRDTGTKQNRMTLRLTNRPPIVSVAADKFKYIVIAQGFYVFFISYETWQYTRYKSAHNVPITTVRVHPTEEAAATGDESGKIFIWRQFLGQQCKMLNSLYHWHHTSVTSIAFTSSGSSFYSSGLESVLVKWNVNKPEMRNFIPRMSAIIIHIAVSADNTKIAVTTADNGIQIIGEDCKIKSTLQEFTYILNDKTGKEKYPVGLRVNPRTNTLVLNGRTGHLQFYSAYSRNLLYNMDIVIQNQLSMEAGKILYNIRVTKAAFNIDWMATGEVYNDEEHLPELRLKFWKYQENDQSYSLNTNIELPHEGGFNAIEFSSQFQVENLFCATAGPDNIIKVWSLEESDNIYKKGKVWFCVAQLSYKAMPIESLSFSQDGSLLAAGFGNTLCIYKADNLKLKAALTTSPGYDGCIHKAQVRIPKQNTNGSKIDVVAEKRQKIMKLFTNMLENNDEALIKEIQNCFDASAKTNNVNELNKIDDQQKEQLFQRIIQMHQLNLFQKVLLYQKLDIACKIHPQMQTQLANYLRGTVLNSTAEKYSSLNAQIHRINIRDRFKAKYRLNRMTARKHNYDSEVTSKLVPLLSVMNLSGNSKQPQLTNGVLLEQKDTTPSEMIVLPPIQTVAAIKHIAFAGGEYAHLVIVCTDNRILIWNLLTLRLQSVLKLSVQHIAVDPQTNLVAAFTSSKELHVFQSSAPLSMYHRVNMPGIHGATWLPKKHPSPRSLNLDWQATSTLYFITKSQEIMFLGSSNDVEEFATPEVAFTNDAAEPLQYSTFGTFLTNQIKDKSTEQHQHIGPLIFGAAGKSAVKSFIEMSTHTMPPLHLLCTEFVKSFVRPSVSSTESSTTDNKRHKSFGRSHNHNNHDELLMNGNGLLSDGDDDDDDDDNHTNENRHIRKMILVKSEEESKKLAVSSPDKAKDREEHLNRVAEETIDIEF